MAVPSVANHSTYRADYNDLHYSRSAHLKKEAYFSAEYLHIGPKLIEKWCCGLYLSSVFEKIDKEYQ